ncbi:unnamed protein product [Paramecium sonneborni]|uniref:Uncharacterized protein n=1 Tax=Paramecium sonneborni TaxID=65129 RepID=A0A8S1KL63_9CILI|nr:unnamed protein product [Paramecium sonneborni]
MTDIQSLKVAFIEFIEKLLPSISDPMSITQQKCQLLIKLLKDEGKTIKDVCLYIQNFKIGHMKSTTNQKIEEDDKLKSPLKSKQPDLELFQPESYFRLNLPNKDLIIKKSSLKNGDLREKILNAQQSEGQAEDTSTPLKLGIEKLKKTPKTTSTFNLFFQQVKGFSIVSREYIIDDIQQCMKEFQRHTKIMGCIEQRSFEVNSGEITDVDKKMHHQNYNFTSYSKQVERQKSFKKMSIFEQKKTSELNNKVQNNEKLILQQNKLPISETASTQKEQESNNYESQQALTSRTYQTSKPSLYSYRVQQRRNDQQGQLTSRNISSQDQNNEQINNKNIQNNESEIQQQDPKFKVTPLSLESTSNQISEIIKLGTNPSPKQTSKRSINETSSLNTQINSLPVSPVLNNNKFTIESNQSQNNFQEQSNNEEIKVDSKQEVPQKNTYTRFNYTQQRLQQIRGNLIQNNYRGSLNNYGDDKPMELRLDIKQLDQNF